MNQVVSGCIVLYKNDKDILLRTIHSFLNTGLDVSLYLVDNSPTDELKDIVNDARVQYVHNSSNLGFGSAHNVAIKKALSQSQYHLVLNPDIYFETGTLVSLYSYMEQNPDIGQVMPKVLYPDGSIQYLCKLNPKPFDLFARRFLPGFLKKIFKNRMDAYEYRNRDYYKEMRDIPYLSGCFMFFRTEVFNKIGLFDERIFMYIEDADITRRVLKASGTAYYPNACVYHEYAKGSYNNWRLTWYNIHGAFIYFNKWGWF